MERSFRKFASLVPADGLIVANGDDKNTRDTLAGMPYLSFGFDAKNDVYGKNFSEDFSEFDVFCGGQPYAHLHLGVIGRHNALNALAACAVAWKFGISGETAAAALAEFHGAGRRLEYKGNFHGADVYDDYAHHPNELHALLQAVRLMHYRRVICAFQPHTYSRTKALFQSFVDELRTADQVVLADIYAAREQNTVGVSSQELGRGDPRRGLLSEPTGRDGLSARECAAGRYHSDRRRRRYLQGRRGAFYRITELFSKTGV